MKNINKLFHGDITLWIVYFFFGIISLIEVYSATSQLTYRTAHYYQPILSHGFHLVLAACLAWVVHWIPWRVFKRVGFLGVWAAIVLLAFLTLFKVGETNGGARWINILGISMQPSEFGKVFLIMYTALILSVYQTEKGCEPQAFKSIMLPTFFTCAFIGGENVYTAFLLWFVIIAMMGIGRIPWKQWLTVFGGTIFLIVLGFGTLKALPKESPIYDWPLLGRVQTVKMRFERKFTKITPENVAEFDFDKIRQRVHANTAIANANFIGRMPGNSRERDNLSQAYSDFIFAIILEEMGLWGASFVMLLYIILTLRVGRIAKQCARGFPAFLVMGLVIMIVAQALLNMLVAVDLFFITGQPLPFISRGGSSLIISGFEMGIFLSVSRYVYRLRREKEAAAAHTNPGLQVAEAASPQTNPGLQPEPVDIGED